MMSRWEKWRLVLGPAAEPEIPLGASSARAMDEALSYAFEGGASLDPSRPYLPKDLPEWLARIREIFPKESVAFLQREALERRNLRALLSEPETLSTLERNLDLVKTLLAAKDLIPERAKEVARQIVREVAAEIRRKLEIEIRTSVVGALRRQRRSPLPIFRNIDWRRTIDRNLKHWIPERRIVIPERFHFRANEIRRREWTVILLVDQSASMAESVVYSSLFASILASLDVLRTHLVLFDTSIVDLTPHLADPVDLLFGARLGGGTDIARAVAYGASLVDTPARTIFVLVSDLHEGGDRDLLLRRLRAIAESGVKALCLPALTEEGRAAYDAEMAREIAELGVVLFAGTPTRLVQVMRNILQGAS